MENELKITKVTRRDILMSLKDIEEVLAKYFRFEELPSTDSRHKDMYWDYFQHRINNYDWEEDWFIEDSRLGILDIGDELFLDLCSYFVHPDTTSDKEIVRSRLHTINSKLVNDGFELVKWGKISGYDFYIGRAFEFIKKKQTLNFYTVHWKQSVHTLPWVKYPCVWIAMDEWNDFGFRTYFTVKFYIDDKSTWTNLRWIKIAHNEDKTTELPDTFTKLNDEYYSLFDSVDAYRIIRSDPSIAPYALTLLESLNDLTVRKDLLEKVRWYEIFNTSLLRSSEVRTLVEDSKIYSFNFLNEHIESSNWVEFNFENTSLLPNRTIAIIGENWSGKTTLLRKIAQWLVQFSENKEQFSIRPSFSKIITISYSVFDSAKPPECTSNDINYVYCGLWENLEVLREWTVIEKLNQRFLKSLEELTTKEKLNIWMYIIKDFFNENVDFTKPEESYGKLSSGQKILVTIFTEILSKIEQWSLILFDEPETHLHPSIIFKLINTLNKILRDYDSYLIIATHSPIVVQQIPSKYVKILIDGYTRDLQIESFWENFSNITREVFGNYEMKDIAYKVLFNDLAEKWFSESDVLWAFDSRLNLNAKIYLNNLYKNQRNA